MSQIAEKTQSKFLEKMEQMAKNRIKNMTREEAEEYERKAKEIMAKSRPSRYVESETP